MIDRRTKLQEILDEMEPGWVVVQPVNGSVDTRCVIQKLSEGRLVPVDLPQTWFDDGKEHQIKAALTRAIQSK